MRISHEIPKQLFPIHDLVSDYPYVLAHLIAPTLGHYDGEYASFYRKKLQESDYSLIDNSCYELGCPIDTDILYQLGEQYAPTHLIIPDIYKDCDRTIEAVKSYIVKYGNCSTPKFFAVIQGNTTEELLKCYNYFLQEPLIDIIGFNFKMDRNWFLSNHLKSGKKIHLLGCESVTEFAQMEGWVKKIIHSVDTSAPIVHGWNGNKFEKDGCFYPKPVEKLADNLDIQLDEFQLQTIYHNVKQFKQYFE